MEELDQITKLWLRLQESMRWSRTVKIAGERILDYVPTFANAGKKLDVWEDPGMIFAMNYVEVSANMRSEIYFFIVSFANYLKSLDQLRIKIDLEKFKETRVLITALRNLYEHWEDNDFRDWPLGKLKPISQKNYQAFVKQFPNSPGAPFHYVETKDMDLSIAAITRVRKTLEIIDKNALIIDEYIGSMNGDINLPW